MRSPVKVDHRNNQVVLVLGSDIILALEPEDAAEIAEKMTEHSDKILAALGVD